VTIKATPGKAAGTRKAKLSSVDFAGYPDVVAAFSEVAHAITVNEDGNLDELLHLIADRICGLLGIKRCSVYLKDRTTGIYRGQVGHPREEGDDKIKRLTVGVDADGFTNEIIKTQKPVLIENAQSDPRPVRAAMRAWKVSTMLGVPMLLGGDVIGVLFLDNQDLHHDYTVGQQELAQAFANLAAIAIAQAQLTTDLRSSISTAAHQNALLQRAAALEDRLSNLVLEGANLSQIAAAITELTGKPCSIHDADCRLLAHGTVADGSAGSLALDPAVLRDPVAQEALGKLTARRPGIIPSIPTAGLHQRCMAALVKVGGDDWGYVILREHRSRFGAQDAIVARRIATIIALELSGKRRAAEADVHAAEALVRDLLYGSDGEASLARRADYHGIALSEPHYLILLSALERGARVEISRERLDGAFSKVAPSLRFVAADIDQGIAVIVESPDAGVKGAATAALKEIMKEVLAQAMPDAAVAAAISTVCLSASDYQSAHDQTRQIGRGISTFGAAGRIHVLAVEELGAGRLLLATAERKEADRFVRDTLGALLDQDDEGIRDLFVTLQAFFDNSRSVRRAAAALGVHENTIRYRFSRIERLTGLDIVADGSAQLDVQLAFLILGLEDRLATTVDVGVVASANE